MKGAQHTGDPMDNLDSLFAIQGRSMPHTSPPYTGLPGSPAGIECPIIDEWQYSQTAEGVSRLAFSS
ncbi:hypothetical protein KTAU_03800 [Thermogemmatispora aurantia]|uniref:Uncharacterized protein n=1 Tax=Thermogemmatispora aurantia TaxID=2045279 RepID=A0A5J4K3Q6_9CHLR|nr:hypothetical protein KTAU_03800 [Thermogemmatispora aurantia]